MENIIKQFQAMVKHTLAFLLLISLATNYDISISCGTSGCASGCKQCQKLSGDPFQGLSSCVDNQGGCNKNSSYTISFSCKGCSNGNDCSYAVSQGGSSFSGCTNTDDKIWPYYQGLLDILYALVKQTSDPYDWCGAACGLPTIAIIGIIFVLLVISGLLGTGICCYLKRKKRAADVYHHTDSLSLLG